jgi:hypothetical protein
MSVISDYKIDQIKDVLDIEMPPIKNKVLQVNFEGLKTRNKKNSTALK